MAEYCPGLIRAVRGGGAARFPPSPGNQRADDFIKAHYVGRGSDEHQAAVTGSIWGVPAWLCGSEGL